VFVRGAGARRPAYRKAVYREYTDDTFRTLKPRPPGWQHVDDHILAGMITRFQVTA
jgi:hypothetical protein